MKYASSFVALIAASQLGVTSAWAKDDVDETVICATQEIHVCVLYEGCSQVKPPQINAPDFIKIDLKKMELTGRRYDGTYGTLKIDKKTLLPKLLLLEGVNPEPDELKDGLAFSVAIDVGTGRMAGSVTTTETVYSFLGACHAL
jgi:hypothetical protein